MLCLGSVRVFALCVFLRRVRWRVVLRASAVKPFFGHSNLYICKYEQHAGVIYVPHSACRHHRHHAQLETQLYSAWTERHDSMGRTKPSYGQPPAAFRKDARAKKAKLTLNKVIPSLLSAHPRAREGLARSELITPDQLPPSSQPPPTGPGPRITLRVTDTLTAAHSLLRIPSHPTTATTFSECTPTPNPNDNTHLDLTNRYARVAILNMASPLSPGGGFLRGASSQEEFLCMRTTLLPSLRDEFYRLPELAAVYTPDVLVFRGAEEDVELAKRDRWFVDCVSAAMLRQPEVEEGDEDEAGDGGGLGGGGKMVLSEKDRELMRRKMGLVMGVLRAKGVRRVVLGAWGCGAYGNPVGEVAGAWKSVLVGSKKGKGGGWDGIEEVVFAIKVASLAERFADAFGECLVREDAKDPVSQDEEQQEDPEAERVRALEEKIKEMELSAEQAKSPQLKMGLDRVIGGLREQLQSQKEVLQSQ